MFMCEKLSSLCSIIERVEPLGVGPCERGSKVVEWMYSKSVCMLYSSFFIMSLLVVR